MSTEHVVTAEDIMPRLDPVLNEYLLPAGLRVEDKSISGAVGAAQAQWYDSVNGWTFQTGSTANIFTVMPPSSVVGGARFVKL